MPFHVPTQRHDLSFFFVRFVFFVFKFLSYFLPPPESTGSF
jgi:hypothetical protein